MRLNKAAASRHGKYLYAPNRANRGYLQNIIVKNYGLLLFATALPIFAKAKTKYPTS
jgi:hypothetical protein